MVELSKGGVTRPAGPILVVPPRDYLTTSRPPLTVAGTAPNVAATASGIPPEGSMHIALPRYADTIRINNTDSAALNVSFGSGLPEFSVAAGAVETLSDSHVSDVFVRGTGATVTFTLHFALVNGIQE